jgi:hypothetical protein
MEGPVLKKFPGYHSLTGAVVRGSSCQDTGWRRGRGENVNTSKPTAYTPLVFDAWKANCFVCVRMLLMFTNKCKLGTNV